MSAFHVERSDSMEIHRWRRNLEELSDRSNRRPWLCFQDLQNSSTNIFHTALKGFNTVWSRRTWVIQIIQWVVIGDCWFQWAPIKLPNNSMAGDRHEWGFGHKPGSIRWNEKYKLSYDLCCFDSAILCVWSAKFRQMNACGIELVRRVTLFGLSHAMVLIDKMSITASIFLFLVSSRMHSSSKVSVLQKMLTVINSPADQLSRTIPSKPCLYGTFHRKIKFSMPNFAEWLSQRTVDNWFSNKSEFHGFWTVIDARAIQITCQNFNIRHCLTCQRLGKNNYLTF
jgi:hypothetical protein